MSTTPTDTNDSKQQTLEITNNNTSKSAPTTPIGRKISLFPKKKNEDHTKLKPKPRIIFEGELFIQGWFSTWRSRYCTLCVNRTLCAYNNKDQAHSLTQPKHILNLSTVITIKQTHNPNQTQSTSTSKKKKKPKFIFEITTSSQDILLSSTHEDIISQWIHHLQTYVFGTVIHNGYMTKQGFIKKSWKKRYFTLSSNWKELRYFENDKMSKNEWKGTVDLYTVKVLRSYVNFAKNEFILELVTLKRTYIFVNEFHDTHITWMNKLEEVLNGCKSCCYCSKNKYDAFGGKDNVYYKMSSLHEGILHTFIPMDKEDIYKGGKWEKNYYAIDGRTMRLFYTKKIFKMESFQNALIEKDFYEQYINEEMDGYYLLFGESIEMIDGNINEDSDNESSASMIYMGTSTIGEIGECEADDVMGPGFVITPTPGRDCNDSDIEDGKDDEKDEIVWDSYDKFRYTFTIGEYIFGVMSSKEAKLWVYGLKNAVDFNMREVYNYDDEKHYLCRLHLGLLICRFYYGNRREINDLENGMEKVKNGYENDGIDDDMKEIPFGAYKYLVRCIGMKCWDNDNLVIF